ncbi:MAG: hypothetical protein K9M07_02825 [Simkaniaceae bacterium]|nr:hypothetical protein [Simkaniaceae bacterium]
MPYIVYSILVSWLFIPCISGIELMKEDFTDSQYQWMDRQIRLQFTPFHTQGITKSMIADAAAENKPNIIRFQVINNRYYGEEGICKEVIQKLLSVIPLPDVDCLYYKSNGPIYRDQLPKTLAPLLAGYKHESCKNVILYHYPYFDVGKKTIRDWEMVGNTVIDINKTSPWEDKINMLIWRGETNGMEAIYTPENWTKVNRGKVVGLTLSHPMLVNARFTKIIPWKVSEIDRLKARLPLSEPLSLRAQIQYKYQICLNGDTCSSSGSLWKLLSNALVFIPDSPLKMWFHLFIIPWKHYIPIRADFSNLIQSIEWAKKHDEEAKQIAEKGSLFTQKHLLSKHLYIYCYKILCEYASHQKYQPIPTNKPN